MDKNIPNEYENQFKSFEEFREFMMKKAKGELEQAFTKTKIKNERRN